MEPRKGILVVDDAIDTLKFLVHTLTSDDQMVRPANGGQQALDAIARQLPELTLLDVRMPGLDGFEVCRRLKADEKTKAIPVQFLSSSTESSERLKGVVRGGVDFIHKPFTLGGLESKISECLGWK